MSWAARAAVLMMSLTYRVGGDAAAAAVVLERAAGGLGTDVAVAVDAAQQRAGSELAVLGEDIEPSDSGVPWMARSVLKWA